LKVYRAIKEDSDTNAPFTKNNIRRKVNEGVILHATSGKITISRSECGDEVVTFKSSGIFYR
jgi:hypothetical protein